MPPPQERAREGRRPFASSERHQRQHVFPARRYPGDDSLVDDLLPQELQPIDQPPDSGMEPEQRADVLLEHDPQPVPPCDVHQLVTGDRTPGVRVQFTESFREQNDRPSDAERDWLLHLV